MYVFIFRLVSLPKNAFEKVEGIASNCIMILLFVSSVIRYTFGQKTTACMTSSFVFSSIYKLGQFGASTESLLLMEYVVFLVAVTSFIITSAQEGGINISPKP